MAIKLGMTSNIKKVASRHKRLALVPTAALTSALNKSGRQSGVAGSKAVRTVYNISAGRIKTARKDTRATFARQRYMLYWSSYRVNVKQYSASWNYSRGLAFKIKKGKRVVLPHAFIPKGNARGLGGKGFRRKGSSRLPIASVTGPSVSQLMKSKLATKAINKKHAEVFPGLHEREMRRRVTMIK